LFFVALDSWSKQIPTSEKLRFTLICAVAIAVLLALAQILRMLLYIVATQ
jgi:hypothetical protein